MTATRPVLVATHRDCELHVPFPGHPDRPERLVAAVEGANVAGARWLEVVVEPEPVLRAVAAVHASGHAERLRLACTRAPAVFDSPDNPISAGTYAAALAAAATSVTASEAALDVEGRVIGDGRSIFAAVRPPGHHALRDRAMGFCFFNNVAIAAEALLNRGVGPVAIVDFDVHHGNGTQLHFADRFDAFYLSVHRHASFPGTGAADEVGDGAGWGYTRNFPLAAGSGDEIYVSAVTAGLDEVRERLDPVVWLVSAGFDAHRDDPLGGMRVTENGFFTIGRCLRQSAGNAPVVAVLEGGYHDAALRDSVRAFVEGLACLVHT